MSVERAGTCAARPLNRERDLTGSEASLATVASIGCGLGFGTEPTPNRIASLVVLVLFGAGLAYAVSNRTTANARERLVSDVQVEDTSILAASIEDDELVVSAPRCDDAGLDELRQSLGARFDQADLRGLRRDER